MPEAIHTFLADQAERLGGGKVLDFGCGHGHVVALLQERGVDAYGTDVFWGGMDWEADGPTKRLTNEGRVRVIEKGIIPFNDAEFDVIVSDQVLEHVENLEQAVSEMSRVLKPAGAMYHQYPALNVVVEAHTKVPFAHRLPRRPRRALLRAAKTVGIGRHPQHIDDAAEWAAFGAEWIDDHCSYRPRSVVEQAFRDAGFSVEHREDASCAFRASGRPLVSKAIEKAPGVASRAFRALGHDCIELRRA